MDLASQFALIRGQEVTAWTMVDGQVMTGVLVATLMGISLDVASF